MRVRDMEERRREEAVLRERYENMAVSAGVIEVTYRYVVPQFGGANELESSGNSDSLDCKVGKFTLLAWVHECMGMTSGLERARPCDRPSQRFDWW